MLQVVADVCGVQAQVPSAAELAIWARVDGVSAADIRDALWRRRSLVRTWAMRGTLHLFAARDLPTYVAALRTHDRWWKGAWLRMIGFSAEELRGILDAIRDSLGARPVTREQLAALVAERAGSAVRKRMLSGWGELLKPAAFEGSLVSGPPRGQSVTFVRPDRWLRHWDDPEPAVAWREILRRYLRAYGPSSREDFARWWGMQPAPAGRILAASADELVEVETEGQRGFALAEDSAALRKAPRRSAARLLPMFDAYVIGTRPRASILDPQHEPRVFRSAGWISAVVLIDAMAAGVWTYERRKGRVDVAIEPFRRLSAARTKELRDEADRLGAFLGEPVDVSFRRP